MESKKNTIAVPESFLEILECVKILREKADDYIEDEKSNLKHLTVNEQKERMKPLFDADASLWKMIDSYGQYAGVLIADRIKL